MRHLRRRGACAAVIPQIVITVNHTLMSFQVVSGEKLLSEKNDTETKKLKGVIMNDVMLMNPGLMPILTHKSGFVCLKPKTCVLTGQHQYFIIIGDCAIQLTLCCRNQNHIGWLAKQTWEMEATKAQLV